ncbi:MAG: M43 family zinc metalloprotease [Saprospiraceae bacterium]
MSVSQLSKWVGILLFLTLPLFAFPQKNIQNTASQRCHTDQKMQSAMDADPAYKKAMEEDFAKPMTSTSNTFGKNSSVVVTIPVHVIIVHPPGQSVGTGVNFSLVHVESQITVLNEDFRRTNADAGNTPSVFPAADVEIEFCLASVDPSGNPTDGITRHATNENLSDDEFSIKSATGWNRNDYLNIWVGPNLGGILGWAYLPGTSSLPNSTLDGVVTASTTFGGPGFGTNVPYHLGRTTTHEVGHYLGLRHVWGSGGCTSDDNIADTPIQSSNNFGCPSHPSPSCSNGGDMFMNYMDYVNDNCMNAFTTGQGERMHEILNNSRSSLLGSAAIVCNAGVPLALELVGQTNIICNGGNDGTITILGSGGSGNYTYTINPGSSQSSNIFTGLAAGTYEVGVDDGSSIITMSVTLTEPTEVIPFISTQINVSCFGENDGSIIVDGAGGTNNGSGYTYSLNSSPFTNNNFFTNLGGGVYTIVVRDGLNCEGETTVVITEPTELLSFVASQVSIDCNGNNNGEVVLGSTGGSPNYLYSFDGGAYSNNNIFTNLSQGVYSVATVDENNCEHSFDVTLVEPIAIQFTVASQTNLSCFGESDGMIEVSGLGGVGNLEYQINGQGYQNSNQFTSLSSGTYNLDVSDENGCVESLSVMVTEPDELLVQLTNQNNIPCSGGNTGSVTINTTGGIGTSSIVFNGTTTVGNSVTFENLALGTYPVLVNDENNCTASATVEITGNPEVDLVINNAQNILCNGETNGQIAVQSAGGSGNFTYFLNGVNQGANNTFTNLESGTYTIESIDDAGCSDTEVIQITEPAILEAQVSQQTNLNCFGENNGSIVINGSGGTGNLQYTLGSETNSTGEFNNLSAGNYTISILDENNCVVSVQTDITQPTEVEVQVAQNTTVDCFGGNSGSIEITASGGTGNFEFSNGTETNTTGVFDNLTAGNYTISVTDENNCETTIQSNITQPTELLTNILNQQDVNCFGENSGMISIEANGGVGNITFTLNGNSNSTGEFPNLNAGTYAIQVLDENNCETTLDFQIDEPTELNIVLEDITQASCTGQEGTIEVSANGGVGNYEFSVGGIINTTGIFNGFTGGVYIVQVEDGNGCTSILEVDINEPNSLNGSISQSQNIDCFGGNSGNVQVTGTGGTGNLTYTLGSETNTTGFFENLSAGSYNIILEDESNCSSTIEVLISEPGELEIMVSNITEVNCYEGNDGVVNLVANGGTGTIQFTLGNETNTTGIFESLTAGTFNFTIEDENGCIDMMEVEINSPIQISTTIVDNQSITCAGEADGMIEIIAVGGANNFEYTFGNETNTNGVFSGISAGTFSFFATDGNGCVEEISFTFDDPQGIEFENVETQNIDCNGNSNGMIQLGTNGGTGILTFTLGNETNTTGVFENLPQGTYEVIATDENNCSTTMEVSIEEPQALEVATEILGFINCFGTNDASLEIIISGGTGDIEYTLGNETNSTGVFENLEAGTYILSATDENNCSFSQEYIFAEPSQLVPNISQIIPVSCFGSSSGAIQTSVTGGTGMPTYTLNSMSNLTGMFDNLPAGTYEVLVVDEMDCSETISITIDEPAEVGLEILNNIPADCAGAANGFLEVQGMNGVGNFTYELNGIINTTGVFENLAAGDYELVTIDGNGCEVITMITIIGNSDITVESFMTTDVDCFGNENGTVNIFAGSPSGDLTYDLNGAINNTGVFENLLAGNYEVLITDVNNCTTVLSFEIIEPIAVGLELIGIVPVDCFGASTGEVMVNGSGGNGDFTYTLNGESNNTGSFDNLPAGIFDVQVMDGEGCAQIQVIEIVEPELLVIEVITTTIDTGNGNGTVTFVGSGGTPPYLFSLDGANFQSGELFVELPGGNYDGYVLDGNGCIVQITFTILMETAVVNLEEGISKLDIFPNPFSDQLFLEVDLEISQELQLTLWNVAGVEVFARKIELQNGNHRINLEVNHQVPAGSYFLKVNNENGSIGYFKLIKY